MLPLYYLEKVDSTNEKIMDFLKVNNESCALFTLNQTNGKGQYGNRWLAEPGKNLAYSLAVEVSEISAHVEIFNFRTACLVRSFIAKMTNVQVNLKWPNDFIIQNKKVGGMLIERVKVNGTEYYIIGIGINVLQQNFGGLSKAGSLFTQTGLSPDLHDFSKEFNRWMSEQITRKVGAQEVLEKYNHNLFGRGRISVFEKEGVRQNGIVLKADENGYLWIDLERDGRQKFYHKQIQMLY